jgi:CheY-like chemotaxis protein
MNILFIEDNPEFSKIVRTLLEARGHTVKLCDNADDTVDELKNLNNYKIVLLDIMMMLGTKIGSEEAKETGIAIYKRLRKINSKIPIVVLTAQIKENIWSEFGADPKATYHFKPPQMDKLYEQVEQVI